MSASQMKTCIAVVFLAPLLLGIPAAAPAQTADSAWWPQFHGPTRDNVSTDTGLLKKWPEGGPKLLWNYSDCGKGWSGIAIAKGMIFSAGDFGDQEFVFALDTNGKFLWKSPNGAAWQGAEPGSRTTPTYVDGMLFHMNPTGRLAAFDASSGKQAWAVDLQSEFGARYGTWAMAENVLVEGDKVLCLPGGAKAFAAALDKKTGKTLWTSKGIDERAAYCSPIVATCGGVRQMITLAQRSVVGIDVATGKLLWSYPFGKVWQNTTSPVFHDGHVFITCGHSSGGQLLKIKPDLSGVTEVWYRKDFDNCHGGVILREGLLYGCGCRLGGKDFFCVDFLTGKTRFTSKALGKVSITLADGMLYCLSDKGKMSLAAIKPDGLDVLTQFDLPKVSQDLTLCHPVVCGGRLYLRHVNHLYAYDVRAK